MFNIVETSRRSVYWPGVFAPVLGVGEGGGRQLPPPTTRVRGYYHRENLDIVHINHAFSCICKILGGGAFAMLSANPPRRLKCLHRL